MLRRSTSYEKREERGKSYPVIQHNPSVKKKKKKQWRKRGRETSYHNDVTFTLPPPNPMNSTPGKTGRVSTPIKFSQRVSLDERLTNRLHEIPWCHCTEKGTRSPTYVWWARDSRGISMGRWTKLGVDRARCRYTTVWGIRRIVFFAPDALDHLHRILLLKNFLI